MSLQSEVLKNDNLGRWFTYDHLPQHLQDTSARFADLAEYILNITKPSAERTVALRKLLEAKDAAVRATIETRE